MENGAKEKQIHQGSRGQIFQDFKVGISPNGELVCGGYYGRSSYATEGIFVLRYEIATNKKVAENFIRIKSSIQDGLIAPGEFLYHKSSAKSVYKSGLKLDHMIFRTDGGVLLVGEAIQEYKLLVDEKSENRKDKFYYLFGDIVFASLQADGTVSWVEVVNKYQLTSKRVYFTSYKVIKQNDRILLLYNQLKLKEGTKARYTAVVRLAEMSTDGKQTNEVLYNSRKEGIYFIPNLSFQINKNEILLRTEWRQKARYGRINL